MSTQTLYRWGGFVSITSGLLIGASVIMRFSGSALAAQISSFIAVLIMIFALTALYVAQAAQGKRLALWGYALAVIGGILTEVISFLWIATYAGMTEAHAIVMFSWGKFPILHIAVLGSFFGLLLFGIATIRAGVFSRWAGILMVIGSLIYTLSEYIPSLYTAALPSVLMISLSLVWMGWTLVAGRSKQVFQATAVAAPARQSM